MSTHVEGGRPIARLRVFGFPVHVDISFVVIIAILGYLSWYSVLGTVIWTAVAPFAVLVHELGHAVVARTTGASPAIALAGFGGLTTFTPPAPMSRLRSISISVAGPMVGLAIGIPMFFVARSLITAGGLPEWAYITVVSLVVTTLGWSVLNLLPVLPLDGGQAMRELLPGDSATRGRRAAAVSIVVAVVIAVVAYLLGQQFVAVLMAFLVLSNALSLRSPKAEQPEPTPAQQIMLALWEQRPEQARELLAAQPTGTVTDLAIHGAVLATTGEVDQGFALLHQELARRPDDADVAALLALAHLLRRDWARLVAFLLGPYGSNVPEVVVDKVRRVAARDGREDVVLSLNAWQPRQ